MTTLICQPIKQPKPCKKHGIVERYKDGRCKKCTAEKIAKYSANNREKLAKKVSKWVKENRFADSMVKAYVSKLKPYILFDLSPTDIPPELVEIKRLQMQLHHAIKNMVQ